MQGILIDTHTRILIYSFILVTVNVACVCFVASFNSFYQFVYNLHFVQHVYGRRRTHTHMHSLSQLLSLCSFLYHSHSFSLKQHRQERKAFVHKAPSKHATHHQTRHMCTLIHQICKCRIKATHTHRHTTNKMKHKAPNFTNIYVYTVHVYVYVYMVQSNT